MRQGMFYSEAVFSAARKHNLRHFRYISLHFFEVSELDARLGYEFESPMCRDLSPFLSRPKFQDRPRKADLVAIGSVTCQASQPLRLVLQPQAQFIGSSLEDMKILEV